MCVPEEIPNFLILLTLIFFFLKEQNVLSCHFSMMRTTGMVPLARPIYTRCYVRILNVSDYDSYPRRGLPPGCVQGTNNREVSCLHILSSALRPSLKTLKTYD